MTSTESARAILEALAYVPEDRADLRRRLVDVARDLLSEEQAVQREAPAPPPVSSTHSQQTDQEWMHRDIAVFAQVKGQRYEGVLLPDHSVRVNGRLFDTPSAAGMDLMNYNVNGWLWWKFRHPHTGRVLRIDALRRRTG